MEAVENKAAGSVLNDAVTLVMFCKSKEDRVQSQRPLSRDYRQPEISVPLGPHPTRYYLRCERTLILA